MQLQPKISYRWDYEMGLLLINIYQTVNIIKLGYGGRRNNFESKQVLKSFKTTTPEFLLGGFTFGVLALHLQTRLVFSKNRQHWNMIWERHYYGNPNENDGRIMAMLESKDSAYIIAAVRQFATGAWSGFRKQRCVKLIHQESDLGKVLQEVQEYDNSQGLMRYCNIYMGDYCELAHDGNFIAITS
jgi:hypothetical protein